MKTIRLFQLAARSLVTGTWILVGAAGAQMEPIAVDPSPAVERETRALAGWTLHIHPDLWTRQQPETARALELLQLQLEEIERVVPAAAVEKLKQVPLWLSPEYPRSSPKAEYHPGRQWLREHGRDPRMERGIEFTNIGIFEAESRRMPNFALHELAHAYHHRVLNGGFENAEILRAFSAAVASGAYERVERQDSEGGRQIDRAYALASPQEYFAESSEAFFSRNDFFPYDRMALQEHDPAICQLLIRLWGCESPPK